MAPAFLGLGAPQVNGVVDAAPVDDAFPGNVAPLGPDFDPLAETTQTWETNDDLDDLELAGWAVQSLGDVPDPDGETLAAEDSCDALVASYLELDSTTFDL